MYNTPHFKEHDPHVVLQFIHQHPFAFLTGSAEGKPVATQLPLLAEERDGQLYLQGHIMRKSDHHKAFVENPQVLTVFTSPHTYVSATWYSVPQTGSTWNYISVHAGGTLRFMTEEELEQLMQKLSLHFEGGNPDSQTVYHNLPDAYTNRFMPAIVGIEIKVESFENIFKLSQNRDEQSYRTIMAELEKQGGDAAYIAREMGKRLRQMEAMWAKG